MHLRWLLGFAVAALLVVAACGDDSGSTAPSATLRIHAGLVEVDTGDGFAAGSNGQTLAPGATVRTGVDGRASIEWFDGSVTRLDFGTTFSIVTMEVLEGDANVIEGEQHTGNTYNRVTELTDSASRFAVDTPTATASVQGTVFAVLFNPDGTITFAVLEGTVIVDGVEVAAGQMVTVDDEGNVGDPEPIPDGLIDDDWIVFNCELDDGPECPDEGTTTTTVAGPVEPPTTTTSAPTTTSSTTTTTVAATPTTTPPPPPATTTTTLPPPTTTTTIGQGPVEPPPPDTTPPVVTIEDGPQDPTNATSAQFDFSSDEEADFRCKLDGPNGAGEFEPCPQPPIEEGFGFIEVVVVGQAFYPDLSEGEYTFTVEAEDAAGNVGSDSFSWEIDLTDPVVSLVEFPDDPSDEDTAYFSFNANEPGVTFECSLDGEDPTECPFELLTWRGITGSVGSAYYEGLDDGSHTFQVFGTDPAGNTGSLSEAFAWEVDAVADFDHVEISPTLATVEVDESQTFTATAIDDEGNSMGDVTAQASFTIDSPGSCDGNQCSASEEGQYTVTVLYNDTQDTATLNVVSIELGSGDVEVYLQWTGPADMDLHVWDPFGCHVYYGNPTGCESGGILQTDVIPECPSESTEIHVEQIYWPEGGAPEGDYIARADVFNLCNFNTPWTMTIYVNGSLAHEVSGTFTSDTFQDQNFTVPTPE